MKEILNMKKYEFSEKKAAQALGVSLSRVSQLIASKQLDSTTINGKIRISGDSIQAYVQARRLGRPAAASYATAAEYTLMNATYEVGEVVFDTALDGPISMGRVFDASRAPFGVLTSGGAPKKRELNDWWRHRSIPSSRPGLDAKLLSLGVSVSSNLPVKNLGLSLSDCYWLRPISSPALRWDDVNYFENGFVDSSPDTWDDWLSGVGLSSPDNTSEGELPKKWVIDEAGNRCLLKGCKADDQRPYNEAVATALFKRLLSPGDYVAYDVVTTKNGPAARCKNFLNGHEEYVPASSVRQLGGRLRTASVYDRFCRTASSLGVSDYAVRDAMSKMIVCDVILANFDRHWRNFGFIRDVVTLELRPAPLFDTGNSLWFNKTDAEIAARDWAFMPRPFAHSVAEALACVDSLEWFDASRLEGFVEEAVGILEQSKHATRLGRIDFIREGLEKNIDTVIQATRVLGPRILRGR